ncbi:unnamed protein product [Spirodela intermedia]|uniref:Uncharacterized protein n=1 Tax=Spirodela intermedia TaxID=51605 RepID=A0A7I8KBA8_SPIIN|nr:unnamed protein product [Spirodela intermedia]
MILAEKYFFTYEQINGRNVLIENNAPCKIRNLISLNTFEVNGCKYLDENRVIKVNKEVIVVMKGQRSGCILLSTCLGQNFWVEIVSIACHLVNKSPTSAINFKTPEEVWRKLNLSIKIRLGSWWRLPKDRKSLATNEF